MYTIRDLKQFDICHCVDVANDLWGSTVGFQTYQELAEQFNAPNSTWPPLYIVALHNNEIIGFAGYRRCLFMANAYESCWVNVAKEHQRAGVGRMLVEERNRRIKQAGGIYVISSVKDPAFSLSNGNKQVDKIGDTYIMVKHL